MSWRTVVITGIAKLDFRMGHLVVRKQPEEKRVHLSEIDLLIIESTTVSLTTALLAELIKKKIKVIFCDEKHNPISELSAYYGSHDTSAKVKEQVKWEKPTKELVATEIVREKIKQQKIHLESKGLLSAASLLEEYAGKVELMDKSNREGHAAKVYFNALFGKEFSRTQDDPINASLNYGYGILLSYFTREIVSSGYITQLGLFHDNMFNQFNFASDLMEPFRVLVDRKVCSIKPVLFEKEERYELINLFNEEVYIDGYWRHISAAIRYYCKSIFDALNENDVSLIHFYKYEL